MLYIFYDTLAKGGGRGSRRVLYNFWAEGL